MHKDSTASVTIDDPFQLPIRPGFWLMEIDLESLQILNSSQKPLVFNVRGVSSTAKPKARSPCSDYLTLAFKGEDMRKDWVRILLNLYE